MEIKFERIHLQCDLLSPLKGFEKISVPTEVRIDPLTKRRKGTKPIIGTTSFGLNRNLGSGISQASVRCTGLSPLRPLHSMRFAEV